MELCSRIVEFLLWVLLTAAIVLLSLSPSLNIAPAILLVGGDKSAHFLAYTVLGLWTFLVLGSIFTGFTEKITQRFISSVVYCTIIGGMLELLQPRFGRTMDLGDFFADVGGGITGALIGVILIRALKEKTAPSQSGKS